MYRIPYKGDISVVDLPNQSPWDPTLADYFKATGAFTRHIEIDKDHKVAYAGAEWTESTVQMQGILVIDLSSIGMVANRDKDNDGWDDRIIGKIPVPGIKSFRLDAKRGLIYAGVSQNDNGLVIVKICECSDLVVDFVAQPGEKPNIPLVVEKKALQKVIGAGLNDSLSECSLSSLDGITMIEQGSGACLWQQNGCGSNYKPGLSDHDYEVFLPDSIFNDATKKDCIIKQLNNQETDVSSDPVPIEVDGYTVTFKDISFFPMLREEFENALLDINPPTASSGDITGDMGMGRQMLLFKWLLEGVYVDVPGLNLRGRDIELILDTFKTLMRLNPVNPAEEPSHIPRLEGYEWARFQESEVYNSGALIRVIGARDPMKTFYDTSKKELHKTAKAGIRAVLARLVAHDSGNKLAVNTTRSIFSGTDGCIDVINTILTELWLLETCDSFEHYVASAAARSVRANLGIFTADEVTNNIYRMYRIKAGKDMIETDDETNEFIAMAFSSLLKPGQLLKTYIMTPSAEIQGQVREP